MKTITLAATIVFFTFITLVILLSRPSGEDVAVRLINQDAQARGLQAQAWSAAQQEVTRQQVRMFESVLDAQQAQQDKMFDYIQSAGTNNTPIYFALAGICLIAGIAIYWFGRTNHTLVTGQAYPASQPIYQISQAPQPPTLPDAARQQLEMQYGGIVIYNQQASRYQVIDPNTGNVLAQQKAPLLITQQ